MTDTTMPTPSDFDLRCMHGQPCCVTRPAWGRWTLIFLGLVFGANYARSCVAVSYANGADSWRGPQLALDMPTSRRKSVGGHFEWVGVLGRRRIGAVGNLGSLLEGGLLPIADYGANRVHVVDWATGITLRSFSPLTGRAWAVAGPTERNGLLVGTDRGWLESWDLERTAVEWRVAAHSRLLESVLWARSADLVVTAGGAGEIRTWNAVDGTRIASIKAFPSTVHGIGWVEPGASVAAYARDSTVVRVFRLVDGVVIQECQAPAPVRAMATAAGSGLVAFSDAERNVSVWPVGRSARCQVIDRTPEEMSHLVFVPLDKPVLAAVGQDFALRLYAGPTWEKRQLMPWPGPDVNECLSVGATPGQLLVAGSGIRSLNVTLTEAGKPQAVRPPLCPPRQARSVSIDKTGRSIAVAFGGPADAIQLHDAGDLSLLRTARPNVGLLFGCVLSPDGSHIVAYGERGCSVWRVTGERVAGLDSARGPIRSVAFSPDGDWIALGEHDGSVALWRWQRSRGARRWAQDRLWITSVSFSSDGSLLASAGRDGTVVVRDVRTGRVVRRLAGVSKGVQAVLVAGGTTQLVIAGDTEGAIRAWDLKDGSAVARLPGHSGWANMAMARGPSEHLLFSGSSDGQLKAWDLNRCSLVDSYDVGERILGVAFADGVVWAALDDGTVRAYRFVADE